MSANEDGLVTLMGAPLARLPLPAGQLFEEKEEEEEELLSDWQLWSWKQEASAWSCR